jgi:putative transcriptional regulator
VTVTHHLDDATIVAYAAGTLGEAHRIVAAAHMVYCRTCREAARQAEAIGAELVSAEPAEAVSDMCRAATLASLDDLRPAKRPAPEASRSGLPKPLCDALGNRTLEELAWKTKGPGVAMAVVPLSPGSAGKLMLLSIGPGRKMPEHGHGGEELTLVLKGSYSDHMGRFEAGDIADLDEETEHTPVADADGVCICLVATEAPTRFRPLWARLLQPLVGI